MENRHRLLAKIRAAALRMRFLRRPAAAGGPPAAPTPFDFDQLARDLAGGLSRREALRRLGTGLTGAALASLGLGRVEAAPPMSARPHPLQRPLLPRRHHLLRQLLLPRHLLRRHPLC